MAKICTPFTDKLRDSSAQYEYFGEKGLEQVYNVAYFLIYTELCFLSLHI